MEMLPLLALAGALAVASAGGPRTSCPVAMPEPVAVANQTLLTYSSSHSYAKWLLSHMTTPLDFGALVKGSDGEAALLASLLLYHLPWRVILFAIGLILALPLLGLAYFYFSHKYFEEDVEEEDEPVGKGRLSCGIAVLVFGVVVAGFGVCVAVMALSTPVREVSAGTLKLVEQLELLPPSIDCHLDGMLDSYADGMQKEFDALADNVLNKMVKVAGNIFWKIHGNINATLNEPMREWRSQALVLESVLTPGITPLYNDPQIPVNCSEFGRQILGFLNMDEFYRKQVNFRAELGPELSGLRSQAAPTINQTRDQLVTQFSAGTQGEFDKAKPQLDDLKAQLRDGASGALGSVLSDQASLPLLLLASLTILPTTIVMVVVVCGTCTGKGGWHNLDPQDLRRGKRTLSKGLAAYFANSWLLIALGLPLFIGGYVLDSACGTFLEDPPERLSLMVRESGVLRTPEAVAASDYEAILGRCASGEGLLGSLAPMAPDLLRAQVDKTVADGLKGLDAMVDKEVRPQMQAGLDALQAGITDNLVKELLSNVILYGTEFQVGLEAMTIAAGKFARERSHPAEVIAANERVHDELKALAPLLPRVRDGGKAAKQDLHDAFKVWPKEEILEELLDIFRTAFGRVKVLTTEHIGGKTILTWMPHCNVVFRLRSTLAEHTCKGIGGSIGAAWAGLGTAAVGLVAVALAAVWLRFAFHDKQEELLPKEPRRLTKMAQVVAAAFNRDSCPHCSKCESCNAPMPESG